MDERVRAHDLNGKINFTLYSRESATVFSLVELYTYVDRRREREREGGREEDASSLDVPCIMA
jgi:hypothetical protein